MDVPELARALIRCASVTPTDAGALGTLGDALAPLGFELSRLRFGAIDNLVAARPGGGRRLGFAGHTDVVPAGDAGAWTHPPFGAELAGGALVGRGAVDMKGAIAAWVGAVARTPRAGAMVLVITGDEEGQATDGTARLMPWLAGRGLVPEAMIVGEPTSGARVGDTIKVGRRGSLNAWITVTGRQGHVAYPARANNPLTGLVRLLAQLKAEPLDAGTVWFEPSNLEITRLEGGEEVATNLIPAAARARVNIRFTSDHSAASLLAWLRAAGAAAGLDTHVSPTSVCEAFLTGPGPLSAMLSDAVVAVTGAAPTLGTAGGTSDARFIHAHCPVVELGLRGATMHQVDEAVPLDDLEILTAIYAAFIERWYTATA